MRRSSFVRGMLSVSALALLGERTAHAATPSVIRIGVPGVGVGNRPIIGGSSVATVALRGLLEEEFRKEGIKIQYSFLRGAGPAVSELFANGLADFGWGLGDLPSIIGHAGGLKTRILSAAGIRQNTYRRSRRTRPSIPSRICVARRSRSSRAPTSSSPSPRSSKVMASARRTFEP